MRVMTERNPNNGSPSDELLASQWVDRMSPCFTDVPERRLLVAVLLDAVRCLTLGVGRPRTEVLAWIRGDYASARIPFRSLCDGLDIEAELLARRLLRPPTLDAKVHRRVGVRRLCDGGMRIVSLEHHPARTTAVVLPDLLPTRLSA
jgi:hypothetical protein